MSSSQTVDPAAAARAYAALFPAVYMRFHRRDGKRRELSGASRAILLHLAQMAEMKPRDRARLLEGTAALIDAAGGIASPPSSAKNEEGTP